ncbi:MAG: divalent-cation tolerance protein CutA [Luteimonas sp.]
MPLCKLAAPVTALVCHCACPDHDSATRIAEMLVAERLAACVNVVGGVTSVYRWRDGIERADEVLLLIKTTAARLDSLQQRVVALHPYELPEVIAVEAVGGSPAYLDWIHQHCRQET